MTFSLPLRCTLEQVQMPDLERLRGALSHKHRKTAFEARREGNQAAGISEISGFCGPAPGHASRANCCARFLR
jgi:hypothetical protein